MTAFAARFLNAAFIRGSFHRYAFGMRWHCATGILAKIFGGTARITLGECFGEIGIG
ncbi:MAG: hypothetical protein WDN46_15905 [Methylocella sp.]